MRPTAFFRFNLNPKRFREFQNENTKRVRKYPACHTLSLFMKQVASENKSYCSALIGDARDNIAIGCEKNCTTTGSYCKARKRLLSDSIKSLLKKSGRNLDEATQGGEWAKNGGCGFFPMKLKRLKCKNTHLAHYQSHIGLKYQSSNI